MLLNEPYLLRFAVYIFQVHIGSTLVHILLGGAPFWIHSETSLVITLFVWIFYSLFPSFIHFILNNPVSKIIHILLLSTLATNDITQIYELPMYPEIPLRTGSYITPVLPNSPLGALAICLVSALSGEFVKTCIIKLFYPNQKTSLSAPSLQFITVGILSVLYHFLCNPHAKRNINILIIGYSKIPDDINLLKDEIDDHQPLHQLISSDTNGNYLCRSIPFYGVDDAVKLYIYDYYNLVDNYQDQLSLDVLSKIDALFFICKVNEPDTIDQMIEKHSMCLTIGQRGSRSTLKSQQVCVMILCGEDTNSREPDYQTNFNRLDSWCRSNGITKPFTFNSDQLKDSDLDSSIKNLAIQSYFCSDTDPKLPSLQRDVKFESELLWKSEGIITSQKKQMELQTLDIMLLGSHNISKSIARQFVPGQDSNDHICNHTFSLTCDINQSLVKQVSLVVCNASQLINKQVAIPSSLYESVAGVYLVYDPFYRESIDMLFEDYRQYVVDKCMNRPPVVVVAAKSLAPNQGNRNIFNDNYSTVEAWCQSNKIDSHIVVSDRYNVNIEQSFYQLCLLAFKFKLELKQSELENKVKKQENKNRCTLN
ncbi:hypothetical protein PPL_00541 [Heterostelium album PN500]|uniref:Uncharacterized protein n=1 Tax=Heterostelium pallidum (strain ATCC 26659 / Pp 5 / PN500) TaxID=670386 RepID=D3AWR3_HETP5|nr:hypothetical protein PPL_00541 [Heterostelium album PN500]EFA86736.1 hypothetical protein PPL_00541 [Heterostelium album PN500]|eukprot:XP_020438840.1 hypothetical protein PPL_00541 [Heterostelium album PN500]